jgi:hypothetical protein
MHNYRTQWKDRVLTWLIHQKTRTMKLASENLSILCIQKHTDLYSILRHYRIGRKTTHHAQRAKWNEWTWECKAQVTLSHSFHMISSNKLPRQKNVSSFNVLEQNMFTRSKIVLWIAHHLYCVRSWIKLQQLRNWGNFCYVKNHLCTAKLHRHHQRFKLFLIHCTSSMISIQ